LVSGGGRGREADGWGVRDEGADHVERAGDRGERGSVPAAPTAAARAALKSATTRGHGAASFFSRVGIASRGGAPARESDADRDRRKSSKRLQRRRQEESSSSGGGVAPTNPYISVTVTKGCPQGGSYEGSYEGSTDARLNGSNDRGELDAAYGRAGMHTSGDAGTRSREGEREESETTSLADSNIIRVSAWGDTGKAGRRQEEEEDEAHKHKQGRVVTKVVREPEPELEPDVSTSLFANFIGR
jgi:hypothetical protein